MSECRIVGLNTVSIEASQEVRRPDFTYAVEVELVEKLRWFVVIYELIRPSSGSTVANEQRSTWYTLRRNEGGKRKEEDASGPWRE